MFKLKELRFEAGLTRAELARALEINQGTLANYENESREADYKTLIKIAGYFGESVDYLIGRTEEIPLSDAFRPLNKKEKSIINTYRNISGESKDVLYELLIRLAELEKAVN